MKQQRGDGHSTNTGSVSVSSYHETPPSTSTDEGGDQPGSDSEQEPLLGSPSLASHHHASFPPLQPPTVTLSLSNKLEDNISFIEESPPPPSDGYLANNLFTVSMIPKQVRPLRPDPEGSSVSSVSSESSTTQ